MEAYADLGEMYRKGQGVPKDYEYAKELFRQPAEQGVTNAQIGLGQMYKQGQGVDQDDILAYKWFHLAKGNGADGEASAQKELEKLEEEMTSQEIGEAKELAREWRKKHGE